MVFWNIHSPLWEVTMCICIYLLVLTLEVLPIVGHHNFVQKRFPWLAERFDSIHKLAPVLAVVGLGLSLLHQSSLGATYGVLKARPIVYKEMMPILFIVSAVAAGPALTVLASKLAALLTPRAHVDDAVLDKISHFIGWALLGYLYLRFWDTLAMNYSFEPGRTVGLLMLTTGSLAFTFWIGEILLGAIVPSIILLNNRLRSHRKLHILALVLVVGGLVAYRWNTNIVSQLVVFNMLPNELAPVYTSYKPSLVEIITGAGVISYGLLMFTMGVRYLNIVDHRKRAHSVAVGAAPHVERAAVPVPGD
jgi:molybdopterin-containing oxidoreductase family membrane subunit